MIGPWLSSQPDRIRTLLSPDWSPVRAAVVLAARNEQAALSSLDAFVRKDRATLVAAMGPLGVPPEVGR